MTLTLNQDGTVRQVICTFIDISKRREAEEALRKSEDMFNKAFHGSPSPMTIASQRDGVYIAVNEGTGVGLAIVQRIIVRHGGFGRRGKSEREQNSISLYH